MENFDVLRLVIANADSVQDQLVTASIAAVIPVLTVIVNVILQRRASIWQRQANIDLEQIKAQLTIEGTKDKARLDYQYEALKRLYLNVDPLLFQLVGQSEGSLHRIVSLARSTRAKRIQELLGEDGYYLRSTVYRLLAPLATLRLIQRKLTNLDLSLDSRVNIQYRLCEQVYYTFTDDFQFARGGTGERDEVDGSRVLVYTPNEPDWKTHRSDNPQVYWRQGLPIGVLDQVIDAFAIPEGDAYRIVNFGEFDDRLKNDSAFKERMDLAFDIFLRFEPSKRPVMWRMLVTQYYLHKIIQRSANRTIKPESLLQNLEEIFKDDDLAALDWLQGNGHGDSEPSEGARTTSNVARTYLELHLPHISESLSTQTS